MGQRGTESGVADLERDSGNVANTRHETSTQIAQRDVEHFRLVGEAALVDLLENQSVREGRHVEHVEEGGLGSSDLVSLLDQVHIVQNFDGTTSDLGGNGESLNL